MGLEDLGKAGGGDGGIRTLDTRYQVWLLSRELVSATHPRLRIARRASGAGEGRAIDRVVGAIKSEFRARRLLPPT